MTRGAWQQAAASAAAAEPRARAAGLQQQQSPGRVQQGLRHATPQQQTVQLQQQQSPGRVRESCGLPHVKLKWGPPASSGRTAGAPPAAPPQPPPPQPLPAACPAARWLGCGGGCCCGLSARAPPLAVGCVEAPACAEHQLPRLPPAALLQGRPRQPPPPPPAAPHAPAAHLCMMQDAQRNKHTHMHRHTPICTPPARAPANARPTACVRRVRLRPAPPHHKEVLDMHSDAPQKGLKPMARARLWETGHLLWPVHTHGLAHLTGDMPAGVAIRDVRALMEHAHTIWLGTHTNCGWVLTPSGWVLTALLNRAHGLHVFALEAAAAGTGRRSRHQPQGYQGRQVLMAPSVIVTQAQSARLSLQQHRSSLQRHRLSLQRDRSSLQRHRSSLQRHRSSLQRLRSSLQRHRSSLQRHRLSLLRHRSARPHITEHLHVLTTRSTQYAPK